MRRASVFPRWRRRGVLLLICSIDLAAGNVWNTGLELSETDSETPAIYRILVPTTVTTTHMALSAG